MPNVGSRGVGAIDKWWILLSLADGAWQLDAPHVLSLGSEAVLCCEPVLGDMWIGSGNKVILLDTHLLSFQVREISVRVWSIPTGSPVCHEDVPCCPSRYYFHCPAAAPIPLRQ